MYLIDSLKDNPLVTKLVIYIAVFSIVITILLSFFQTYLEFEKRLSLVKESLIQIGKREHDNLAKNLWDLDIERLENQLNGVMNTPYIHSTLILDERDKRVLQLGDPSTQKTISYSVNLVGSFSEVKIGTFYIHASLEEINNEVFEIFISILKTVAMTTFLTVLFIMYIVRKYITSHLSAMAKYTENFNLQNLNTPLQLNKVSSKNEDELDKMVKAFNLMRLSLKNSFEDLEKSKKMIKDIVDTAPVRIFWKDKDGVYLGANKLFLKDAGLNSEEEILGKTDFDLPWKEQAQVYMNDDKKVMETKVSKINYEVAQIIKGSKKYLVISKVPLLEKNDEVFGVLAVYNDISEFRFTQEQLKINEKYIAEQDKMASLGEMISNIAHQWRQPLSVISTVSTGLKLQNELKTLNDDLLNDSLTAINNNAQYLSKTIETFRNFINEKKDSKEVVLQEVLKEIQEISKASLQNNHIELIDNIDYSNPIKISLVIGELTQVLMNIFNNAKDVLVERNIESPWIKLSVDTYGNKVIISIEDNAGGIPQNILSKIFEPYFTTKHKSKGTGLGLHMSYKIITESLNGKLYVDNSENGAMFFIELALVDN